MKTIRIRNHKLKILLLGFFFHATEVENNLSCDAMFSSFSLAESPLLDLQVSAYK